MRQSLRTRDAGFTLLEVMISMTFLTLAFVVVGMGIQTGTLAARELESQFLVQTHAQNFIDVMLSQSFGDVSDPDPTTEQLEEIFDDDAEPGDVTLQQLSRWPARDDGWRFSWNSVDTPGEWRIVVHSDLDDNGVEGNSTLSPARMGEYLEWKAEDDVSVGALEKSDGVLRIDVFYNGEAVLSTLCSREVNS